MNWIKNLFYRTWNATTVFWMVWLNPNPINEQMFKINMKLFEFIITVRKENRPYFTRFGHIHPDDGETPIVTIWAAPGADSSPEKRIKELLEENESLRAQINRQLDNSTNK